MIHFQIVIKIFLIQIVFTECSELIVNTTHGLLRGREFQSRNGLIVAAFSGIPFAKPPIGELRFQDPQTPEPWFGIRDAYNVGNVCVQIPYIFPAVSNLKLGNEDCLYLSVYTPTDPQTPEPWSGIRDAYNVGNVCVQIPYIFPAVSNLKLGNEDCLYLSVYTPTTKPSRLLPVFVYLFGGGFAFGSGEVDKSPEFFMDHDVVMVMPNYRLGPLGFLSLEDDIIGGNMGLKDQNMALLWVRNNIANFGGDPGQVTLIGESIGGASVHYHMYSPMSRGLFHKGISQSGTAFAPWGNKPPGIARSRAINFAQLLNCSIKSSEVIRDCLRTKNAFDIAELYTNITTQNTDHYMGQVIDKNSSNPFLPFDPHKVKPVPIPWIVGTVAFDGFTKTAGYILNSSKFNELDQNFFEEAPKILFYDSTALNPDEISRKIREYYFDGQPISKQVLKNLTDMFSDNRNFWPSIEALKQYKGRVYFYNFNFVGQNSYQDQYAGKRVLNGAVHLDDTIYIWKINNPVEIPPPTTSSDSNISHLLVKLFVNFASFGDPTHSGTDFIWPQWDNNQQNFISVESGGVVQCSHFLPDRMQFWAGLPTRDKIDGVME